MKRRLFSFLLMLLLSIALVTIKVCGTEKKTAKEDKLDGEAQELIDEFCDTVYGECGIDAKNIIINGGIGIDGFVEETADVLGGYSGRLLPFFMTVVGFAILSVVSASASFSTELTKNKTQSAVLVVFSCVAYPQLNAAFTVVAESLESIASFFGAAMPVMTAITTASGAVNSAGIQAMNMNIILGVLGSSAVTLLLPLAHCMLTLALISSMGEGGIYKLSGSIKNLFTFGLGIVSAASSAIIALQSVIAGARDSAMLRAARYAAGGLIPVVGSSVSGALSTLAGGLAYAKSTVGASAIVIILFLSITPLVLLLMFRLAFSVSLFVLEFSENSGGVRCFSAFRTAIDSIISVYVMSTLVCIVQFIVFMKGGASA